jgi:hypothetical protein
MWAVIRKGDGKELARTEFHDIAEVIAPAIADHLWPANGEGVRRGVHEAGASYLELLEVDVPLDKARHHDVVLRRSEDLRWRVRMF